MILFVKLGKFDVILFVKKVVYVRLWYCYVLLGIVI